MRSAATVVLVSALLMVPAGGAGAAAPSSAAGNEAARAGGRALWVWHEPDGGLLRFARRHAIDRLYVHVPAGRAADPLFQRLARRAADVGIALWATNGHAAWASAPAPLGAWVREVRRAGGYAGIVLDVEPYLLPAWRSEGREELQRSYLRAMGIAGRAAGRLPVLAAVPFWFDHDDLLLDGRSMLSRTLSRVDGVVVMAYRDRADGNDGIVRLVGGELAEGALQSKTVVIGVQTAADELDKLTFFEEGAGVLDRELDAVTAALRGAPAFDGIAIHHYDAYRALRR